MPTSKGVREHGWCVRYGTAKARRVEQSGCLEPNPHLRGIGFGGVRMSSSRRLLALLIVAAAGLTACGRYASAPEAAAGYRLFLEEGYNDAQQVTVLDSGGAIERRLPIGTPAPDWSRYYTVTALGASAQLTALDPASGKTLGQATIPAGYQLPSPGFQAPTAGLSPN